MSTKRVYSISELAGLLAVSPTAVRKWLAAGVIEQPEYEGGGALLFTEQQVQRIRRIVAKRRAHRKAQR